ncbi:MAG: histidinol-phosphate aminotransferase, partial [Actinomycetota bacterium]
MTSLADLPIRDDLRGKSPYGAPQKPVRIALNVNENTHPVPAEVVAHVAAAVERELHGVNRYPDREFTLLREHLADYLTTATALRAGATAPATTIRADQVWAANGSNEVIQHILQAFGGPGRRVLGFPPT